MDAATRHSILFTMALHLANRTACLFLSILSARNLHGAAIPWVILRQTLPEMARV